MRQADVLNNISFDKYNINLKNDTSNTLNEKIDDNNSAIDAAQLKQNFCDQTVANVYQLNTINQVQPNRMPVSVELPLISEVIDRKKQKKLIIEGTELFNSKPQHGIEFLSENGILMNPLDPKDVALWLRNNPCLDKNKIADYICEYFFFE